MNKRNRKTLAAASASISDAKNKLETLHDAVEAYNEAVSDLQSALEELDEIRSAIEDAASDVRCIADEEQEHYDNMPENLQYSERADAFQENADNLSDAADTLESMVEELAAITIPDGFPEIEMPDPDDLDEVEQTLDDID